MYKHNLKQLEFVEFSLPFHGELSRENKWVKLAALIPWEPFEERYQKSFSNSGVGHPALSVRMALAALIIKEELSASDRACVEQITEDPYLQYLCGLKASIIDPPFDASMFVHFRKRFPADVLIQVNNAIAQQVREKQKPPEDPKPPQIKNNDDGSHKQLPHNQGRLLVDATCAPADITFPTDLKLLNKAREKSEQIIDEIHKARGWGFKRPRTYRQRARKQFLSVAKDKRISLKKMRQCCRQQLGYLGRSLKSIDRLTQYTGLEILSHRRYKELRVISEVLRQQQLMHTQRSRRIDDRIVSISQPHVRPIKRGKAGADTEFGAKVSISLVNGVEGKFGQGKRRYSLNRIMMKLPHTSETAIMLSFLVMNLKRWIATTLFFVFTEQECFSSDVYFASNRGVYLHKLR